jgi:hypothetical protein
MMGTMQIPTDDITRQVRRAARQVAKAREQLTPELPEKLVLQGLGAVKSRARNRDLVGEAAYRTLRILNQGLTPTARTLTRIADAVQPPVTRRPTPSTATAVVAPSATSETSSRSSSRTSASTPRRRTTTRKAGSSSRPGSRTSRTTAPSETVNPTTPAAQSEQTTSSERSS